MEVKTSGHVWFVGAIYGKDDQIERFLTEGIWQNGYQDKYLDVVRSMQPGDRIAIKSSYVRKHGLPFDNKGQAVSVMGIKAIGVITRNHEDGRFVDVDWDSRSESIREWYFYTNRSTIWRVSPGDWMTDGLISFAFKNKPQDIDKFRNAPYWNERFGDAPAEKQRFKWATFYEEFADKLLAHKEDRSRLMAAIHELPSKVESISVLQDKTETGEKELLTDICPFTVFGLFNRGITDANRISIAEQLASFLEVDAPVPRSFEGIPVLNNQRSWFFGYKSRREEDDIDILWALFEAAIEHSDNTESDTAEQLYNAYEEATYCWGAGWNLSMGLYWIRPWKYLTLDGQSQTYITNKLSIKIEKNGAKGRCSSKDYFGLIDDLEARFQEDIYPVHSFPELSLSAWLFNDADNSSHPKATDFEGEQEDDPLELNDHGLPKFDDLMIPFLKAIGDGKEYKASHVIAQLKEELGLEHLDSIVLPSTGKPLFDNRAAWAKSYLKKAELVEFPQRGNVQITLAGKQLLELPEHDLRKYSRFTDFFAFEAESEEKRAEPEPYGVDDILLEGCFVEKDAVERMLSQLRGKKNIVLQGPPGTGKTWLAKKLAYALMGQVDEHCLRAVQFHPNLSYEDFVRGWRPSGDGKLTLSDGPFLEMINRAKKDAANKYVVVIEEINRGNPAQILGEMLTLLEADKRTPSEALELSYRRHEGERVHIPANLYVIGTMNIADRSLALVDLALRRRFAFVDLKPALGKAWGEWVHKQSGIDQECLALIEKKLTSLNEEISSDRNLGPQFKIGHSYVTPPLKAEIDDGFAWFRSVVETEIGPLLEEYWFDDVDKAVKAKNTLLEDF